MKKLLQWLPEEERDIFVKSGVAAFVLTVLFAVFVFVYTSLVP